MTSQFILCSFQFVAHPYCQRKMMSLWYGNQYFFKKGKSLITNVLKAFPLMLIYPFLAVIYWLMPDSKVSCIFFCF